ncbi:MAG: Lacal_2735 family protein [Saprospiraceae bacterium]|nr:Lacal_2735 family protein [Saprospiraceae bacterium]
MLGLFKKDPIKKMEKAHAKMLEEAMHIQRSGDIKGYAAKMAEADELEKKIIALRKEQEDK